MEIKELSLWLRLVNSTINTKAKRGRSGMIQALANMF
jgi:hypothetical protein